MHHRRYERKVLLMATAVRSLIAWANENGPIYTPGSFGESGDVVTLHADRNIELEAVGAWRPLMFARLSMSSGSEVEQLTRYFLTHVVRSIEVLADPYGSASEGDPFEYRSVPNTQARTVHARLRWTGPIRPSPFSDD
jgi:hypothetical protein